MFSTNRAKLLNMTIALQTLDYLNNETEYIPWTAAGSEMNYISTMLRETELYGHFEVFGLFLCFILVCLICFGDIVRLLLQAFVVLL